MVSTGFTNQPGEADTPALGGLVRWPDNASMFIDVDALGYLGDIAKDPILDATYGKGNFWKGLPPPPLLVTNDINPDKGTDLRWDVGTPPAERWIRFFRTAILDLPYKLNGTAEPHEHESYGVGDGLMNGERLDLLVIGAHNVGACVKVGGHLLVKTQPNVAGGRVRWQPRMVANAMEADGDWRQVDEFIFQNRPRPQPGNRRQLTARRNYSVLSVFKRLR